MRPRVLISVVAVLSLATACVRMELEEHSFQFNEAMGSLSLRLLLLNGVRASKDYPLQFSSLTTYQGKGQAGGQLSATLPLQSFSTGSLAPRLDLNDGISQIGLADLNTLEAQAFLKKQLTQENYNLYYTLLGSRSPSVLNFAMIERVDVEVGFLRILLKYVDDFCSKKKSDKRCEYRRYLESECGVWRSQDLPMAETPLFLPFPSSVAGKCQFYHLTRLGVYLHIVRMAPRPVECKARRDDDEEPKGTPTTVVNVTTGEPKSGGQPKRYYELVFDNPQFMKEYLRYSGNDKDAPAKSQFKCGDSDRGLPVSMVFRSPERMVRLIGEVIAAQNYREDSFTPKGIDLSTGETFDILRVVRGLPPPGTAAVQVRDPEGEYFYVPKPDYGAPDRDRSLEFLSLVADFVSSSVSKKALPEVTTFSLIGP